MEIKSKGRKKVSEILNSLSITGKKGVAWLIDPDVFCFENIDEYFFSQVCQSGLDLIFIGGSQGCTKGIDNLIFDLQQKLPSIPKVIFPGSELQISDEADALLFMSLLSGRNPEYLIGRQVKAVDLLKSTALEILPTAYILVNDGDICSVHVQSDTSPMMNEDVNKVVNTALAGKYLGMKYTYLEAGSGSKSTVSSEVIQQVKNTLYTPLIVGGGLDDLDKVRRVFEAGADLIVVGTKIEQDPGFLIELLDFKTRYVSLRNMN